MSSSQHSVTVIIDSVTFIGVFISHNALILSQLVPGQQVLCVPSHPCTILHWLIFSHTTTTVSSSSFPLLCQFPTVLTCYLFRFTLVFCGFLYFPSLNEALQYFPYALVQCHHVHIHTFTLSIRVHTSLSSIMFPVRLYSLNTAE